MLLTGHLPDWFHCVFFKTKTIDRLPAKPIESWRALYHASTFDMIQVESSIVNHSVFFFFQCRPALILLLLLFVSQTMLYGTPKADLWTCKAAQYMMNAVLIHPNVNNVVSFLRWWVSTPPTWDRAQHQLDQVRRCSLFCVLLVFFGILPRLCYFRSFHFCLLVVIANRGH